MKSWEEAQVEINLHQQNLIVLIRVSRGAIWRGTQSSTGISRIEIEGLDGI